MLGNLSYTMNVKNWEAGDYYISLQAIDPMHNGSEWSDYTMFNNDLLFADFELSEQSIAPHDTVVVRFTGSRSDAYTFHWNFGTATVVENIDNQLIKLTYNSAGDQEISLTIENASGLKSELYKQTVFVKSLNFNMMELDYIASADFDADGDIDMVTTNGLYVNDGNANFTKLATIFNLTFEPRYALWEDYDKDGDPDLLYSINDVDDGQSGILINNGNGDFTEESKTFPYWFFSQTIKADIDRDGNIDYFYRDKFYINNGDYTFTEKTLTTSSIYYKYNSVTDLNNDNFVDVWVAKDDWLKFFINQKDGTFNEIPITLPDEFNNNTTIYAVRDFNNDNLPDILVKKNSQAFHIFVNQGNNTFDYGKDIIFDFELYGHYGFADFDNNGTTDIAVGNGMMTCIVFIDKDMNVMSKMETDQFYARDLKMIDLNGDNMADALYYVHTSYPSSYSPLNLLMLREGFTTNTAPTTPQDVIAYQTENGITIKWQHEDDAETPQHKLQYNLSIKDINSGEYLFSPAVSNKDSISPLFTRHYITGNAIELNTQLIPTGEYEISLQSIDAWGAYSAFSEPIKLNITIAPSFEIPEFACSGSEVIIKYTGNSEANNTYSWDFDDATVVSGSDAGPYTVKWETGGLKNVTVDVINDQDTVGFTSGIRISQVYTGEIIAPNEMLVGIADTITLPAIPDNSSNLTWTIPDGQVEHNNFAETASIIFDSEGEKTIQVNWSENGCPAGILTNTIMVQPALPIPKIDVITANQNGKGNSIYWTSNFDSFIEKILIYKEGSVLNDFEKIAELDASTFNQFDDTLANINQRTYRYGMALKDQWGHISNMSPVHKTVHLRINKAINGWNLFWNRYHGMAVGAYKVYRGTSPDNMTLLEQVPASSLSYTDLNPPIGELFYSLEIVKQTNKKASQTKSSKSTVNSTTNYVSTNEAFDPIYIDSVALYTSNEKTTITEPDESLVILSDIYPANATLKTLTWEITSGSEFATIDQNGVLKAIDGKSGTVVITAKSQDGSAKSGSITIDISTSINESPIISDISTNPSEPGENDAVNISATVTDSDGSIESVVLNWGLNSDNLSNQITMQSSGDVFTASTAIPAQSIGTNVYCTITATDNESESATTSIFYYTVIQQGLITPPYAHDFSDNTFGIITLLNMAGPQTWEITQYGKPAPCAKMSGHNGSESIANTDWMILPGFDFSEVTNAVLQFNEAINHAYSVDNMKVMISTEYSGTGDPGTFNWTTLDVNNRAAGDSYDFVTVSPIDLSNWYGQGKVYIAFLYLSGNNNAATWEVDNISIAEGTVSNEPSQINNSKISLYPNPVKSILNIEFEGGTNFTISIFDIQGRAIGLDTNYGVKAGEDNDFGRKLIDVSGFHQDSNLDLRFRKPLFYPLNYGLFAGGLLLFESLLNGTPGGFRGNSLFGWFEHLFNQVEEPLGDNLPVSGLRGGGLGGHDQNSFRREPGF